jgi:crotonobetainyl-CoA:carnitine CoA-transferase CaiB-like acyl-CoA transferase
MAGPLSGIRVLDLTTMAAGPLATAVLAEQGADVVKVEPLPRGDPIRALGTPGPAGMSAVFNLLNRGKRSLALDPAHPRAHALLLELVARVDVFAHNLRPGAAERRGLGEAALRALNPGLIYASISGFGDSGPLADRRAYDTIIQARAGLAGLQGEAEPDGRPRFINTALCDKVTGLYVAQAITAALLARAGGAGGAHVRVAMLDAALAFLWSDGLQQHTYAREPGSAVPPRVHMPAVRATADGWLTFSAHWDADFQALCGALELPELAADPRFADAAGRVQHADALAARLDARLRTAPTRHWLARLEAQDVACAPVYAPAAAALDDPQVRARQLVVDSVHPSEGPMRAPRPVARFDPGPDAPAAPGPAPRLGEHTADVLGELGVPAAELARLRVSGAIGGCQ